MEHQKVLEVFDYCLKIADFPPRCKLRLSFKELRYGEDCTAWADDRIKQDGYVEIAFDSQAAAEAGSRRLHDVFLHELAHAALQYARGASGAGSGHTAYFLALTCLFYRRFDALNGGKRVPLLEAVSLYDMREESILTHGQALEFALSWSKENMDRHDDAITAAERAHSDYIAYWQSLEEARRKEARGVFRFRLAVLSASVAAALAVVSTSALAALLH